jgi:hypothetical protein
VGHLRGGPELRRIVELLHDQDPIEWPDQNQVLLSSSGVLAERCAAGVLQRLAQQAVGTVPTLVRAQIVHLLQIDPVDRGQGNKLRDVDGICRLLVQSLDLLGSESDILAFGELVPLGDVILLHHSAFFRADVLLLEPGAAGLVQHVEADRGGRLAR